MITTKAVLSWVRTLVSSPSWTIGKLDTTKDQTMCLYGGRDVSPARAVIGGGANGYYTKRVQIVLRWTNNFDTAEQKVLEVYSSLKSTSGVVVGKRVWIIMVHEEPVSMGTDDKGVYEYSIIMNLICER